MVRFNCPDEWSQWVDWLGAGLHGRHRWRLAIVLVGILFAGGRRTVTSWLRAAAVGDHFSGYYYFIASVGRNTGDVAWRLLVLIVRRLPLGDRVLLVIDDSPTKRYGPKVQGADIHHNPTPGPADQQYLYGHIWVTASIAVRHAAWGTIALPLWGLLYVRQRTIASIPKEYDWKFRTKLQLAVMQLHLLAALLLAAGKKVWAVVDGAYAKRPFLRAAIAAGVVVISRLRKDAALRDVPPAPKQRGRGRPRRYGKNKISLAKRAAHRKGWKTIKCNVYGKIVTKTYKTFLATYVPAGGVIRVVIVREARGCQFFFATDPQLTAAEIIEAFADRASIEQDFHDVKEVDGAGQQQVRDIWANIGAYNLILWTHTLVELWGWHRRKEEICDRSDSPWDDPTRRPSHADRRKALRRLILENELSTIASACRLPRKILRLAHHLIQLAA